jgi:hypothetical protein
MSESSQSVSTDQRLRWILEALEDAVANIEEIDPDDLVRQEMNTGPVIIEGWLEDLYNARNMANAIVEARKSYHAVHAGRVY